jgi:hypothetical protein
MIVVGEPRQFLVSIGVKVDVDFMGRFLLIPADRSNGCQAPDNFRYNSPDSPQAFRLRATKRGAGPYWAIGVPGLHMALPPSGRAA